MISNYRLDRKEDFFNLLEDVRHLFDIDSIAIYSGADLMPYINIGINVDKDKSFIDIDKDGFLKEMWESFDAMFDWGDCDFFDSDKCKLFAEWLKKRLSKSISDDVRKIYSVMYDYALKAIKNGTGLYFDF